MTRPSDLPEWASGATYATGPDAGTATKIEPSAGEKADGNVRGTAPSPQKFNWWMNLVSEWVEYFADETPTTEWFTTPGTEVWTKPTWAKRIEITVVGAGGGGGGGTGSTGGGGGGGGEVTVRTLPGDAIGATVTVFVGTGGDGATWGGGDGATGEI
ncbi:MAG TPA: hypothetical protein VM493_07745, partial [Vicinamibacterales bacterium]|nr:hypothetical protein [Vicinamibacterales bacterium]